MKRLAIAIEHIRFQPVESLAVPGGPDDVGDSRLGKIETAHRIDDAVRVRPDDLGLFFQRQVQTVGLDIGIGLGKKPQMVGIPLGDILRQVTGNADHAILEPLGHPEKGHATIGKTPEIDRLAAISAADGDGHMLAPAAASSSAICRGRPATRRNPCRDRTLAAGHAGRPKARHCDPTEKFIGNLRSDEPAPTTRTPPSSSCSGLR